VRVRGFVATGFALALAPAAAAAQEESSEAGSPFSYEAEATFNSDYRYRGVSLTGRQPGVQANVTASHASGLYGDAAVSTMAESDGGARSELGFSLGYAIERFGLSFDGYGTWYAYPGDSALNFVEAGVEISRSEDPVKPRFRPSVTLSYAPAGQDALENEDNFYASARVEYGISGGFSIGAQAGYEDGAFDLRDSGGKWDWEAGLSYEAGALTLGLAYIDSNAQVPDPRGRSLADATLVASVTIALESAQ